jgi:hypothetical protein
MRAANDRQSIRRLQADYLSYTAAEIDYYSRLNDTVFGRRIPDVMLLHANRLNADLMDQVLSIFERKQYRFITLEQAQSDPAYETLDTLVTKFGPMWGYRRAQERGIKVNGRLEPDPPRWILDYGVAR